MMSCIRPDSFLGRLSQLHQAPAFPGGVWYEGTTPGDGLSYDLAAGPLAAAKCVSLDAMLGGDRFVTFRFSLLSGDREAFGFTFSPLNWCQTRVVRELPPELAGRGIDSAALTILRKTDQPARFCLTPISFSQKRPPRLARPALPKGPLLDEIGQSTIHRWPGKTRDAAEMVDRLRCQLAAAPSQRSPDGLSRWGGWRERRVEASGFFHTHHDGRRWWLVDPDGHLFWSSGVDCVHATIDHETRYETRDMVLADAVAEMPGRDGEFRSVYGRNPYHDAADCEINLLQANFIRAFGADSWYAAWSDVAAATLRQLGFNTAGNWSDEAMASRAGIPYVRPLELSLRFEHTPVLIGNLPDVYHPGLERDVAAFAEVLRPTVADPAMIGYFLHNEPHWWFGDGTTPPAEEMLRRDIPCASRKALVRFLSGRYGSDAALASAWGMQADFDAVAHAQWEGPFSPPARVDLAEFSTLMLERLITALSDACRKVDPNHLNLGVRWWTFPPVWALRAMGSCDVISINYYQPNVDRIHYGRSQPEPGVEEVCARLDKPFLVGEWHFGAFDAGLPSAGLYAVCDQTERGKAFRAYLEDAASKLWCVGAHWFNLYDRNALYYTVANENYNIGFLDIAHRAHGPLCRAARLSHERLYAVASGAAIPYSEPVKYVFPSR